MMLKQMSKKCIIDTSKRIKITLANKKMCSIYQTGKNPKGFVKDVGGRLLHAINWYDLYGMVIWK